MDSPAVEQKLCHLHHWSFQNLPGKCPQQPGLITQLILFRAEPAEVSSELRCSVMLWPLLKLAQAVAHCILWILRQYFLTSASCQTENWCLLSS